jgi:hypothetical protein
VLVNIGLVIFLVLVCDSVDRCGAVAKNATDRARVPAHAQTHVAGPAPAPTFNSPKSAADLPHASLEGECATIKTQLARVPALRDAIQHRDQLQAEFAAINATKTSFRDIARVGAAHKAATDAVLQQQLSEDDYLTLADRHAALVQEMTKLCKGLVDAEDFESVTHLGAKLKQLQALDVSSIPPSRNYDAAPRSRTHAPRQTLDHNQVIGECSALVAQLADAPRTQEAIQLRDKLQNTFSALKADMSDFEAIGQAGKAHKEAVAVVTQLPLSEEDYLTLADRHAALVQKVTTTCAELVDASEFDALDALATKLEELRALDVSGLPQSWANDPVQPPAPPATVEAEDDGANDPVYVPPGAREITLA